LTTRLAFHEDLRRLEDSLVGMAIAVASAVEQSVRALEKRDGGLAQDIIAADEEINERLGDIERETMELIATQQPMAKDLREILAITAIATDLERIGDHAKGIARITLRLADDSSLELMPAIPEMADRVGEMLPAIVDSFVHRDAEAAERVAARDDDLDLLYLQAYHRLIEIMTTDRSVAECASRQLWAAKSLERIGDHITNIAERVVFVVKGEIVELNPARIS
jgi:phosphate transport system protein